MGHMDVVGPGDLSQWTKHPFPDTVENGVVFGRGAIDDKHSVFGILEALSHKVRNDERPNRTFYIAFGHDEEVGGDHGAAKLSRELKSQLELHGETLDFILDEGMFVMDEILPGVNDFMIYIGVAEKGATTLNLTVEGEQVHSSIPPRESSIGILSNAVRKLEQHRQPSRLAEILCFYMFFGLF